MIKLADYEDFEKILNFLVCENGESIRNNAEKFICDVFSKKESNSGLFIFWDNDQIIGVLGFEKLNFFKELWSFGYITIEQGKRGKGYGEQLVNFCLNEISKKIESEAFVILGTYPNKTGLYDKTDFFEVHKDNDHGSFMMKKIKPIER